MVDKSIEILEFLSIFYLFNRAVKVVCRIRKLERKEKYLLIQSKIILSVFRCLVPSNNAPKCTISHRFCCLRWVRMNFEERRLKMKILLIHSNIFYRMLFHDEKNQILWIFHACLSLFPLICLIDYSTKSRLYYHWNVVWQFLSFHRQAT